MAAADGFAIVRTAAPGVHATALSRGTERELFLTATAVPGEDLSSLLTRVTTATPAPWRIVGMTVFNGGMALHTADRILSAAFGKAQWPITWLESEDNSGLAPGIEVHAVSGVEVRTIRAKDRSVACVWEDVAARYCRIGDIRDEVGQPPQQLHRVLESMLATLHRADMSFRDVYRTWFHNRDLLRWYQVFNRVRSAFFEKNGVFDGLLPASTVIGAASHPGAALVAGLLAIQPKTSVLRVAAVPSPLQREPINYGSAFSRAAELDFGDHRRLTVSGTASIDAGGRTVCVNDVEAQMATAMKVVAALLASRRMGWRDVTRCVAYFRRPADTRLFARACEVNSVGALPAIISHHTICRDDLLFEMEVDAVTANS